MKYSARSRDLLYDKIHFVLSSQHCERTAASEGEGEGAEGGEVIFGEKLTILLIFFRSSHSLTVFHIVFNFFLKFIRCSTLPAPPPSSFTGPGPFLSNRRPLRPYTFAFLVL